MKELILLKNNRRKHENKSILTWEEQENILAELKGKFPILNEVKERNNNMKKIYELTN